MLVSTVCGCRFLALLAIVLGARLLVIGSSISLLTGSRLVGLLALRWRRPFCLTDAALERVHQIDDVLPTRSRLRGEDLALALLLD
jgi:hypothetical protein